MQLITSKTGNTVKIFAKSIENSALQQISELADFEPYKDSKIRIMPDCHAGIGCTIGTTMTISDKVTPNLVGVDIGCGMLTIKLKEKDIDPEKLDRIIHRFIPSGKAVHSKPVVDFNFTELRRKNEVDIERASKSLGSLGGGNHFIEIDRNSTGDLYLVIHSGSRHIGHEIARSYQNSAVKAMTLHSAEVKKTIDKLKAENRHKEIEKTIKKLTAGAVSQKHKNLAYLEGELFDDYMNDMQIMQHYASVNRRTIADIILEKTGLTGVDSFETVHNYIDFKRMILRKGAVSAEKGEKLLIPLNMRDGSLICIGKGNPDWNYSAPHGAGRLMSRTEAKNNLDLDEFQEQMKGIYTTSVSRSTIDEAPGAYKPMDEIIDQISETVEIAEVIKPAYNFKAH